ncbi:hypothetical protein [Psychroserpens luteolus]|uniref:hypothetical protein n=1 Tax=Psychroserpens luteolus TaxID=2855840 RepID=UPI001E28E1C9|nr:hypothetical protein [Psychroserpens luteolus]MCD2259986.1 hypothetical protein [Psychroserpens luteolus]
MGIPKKGSRRIVIDNHQYRYMVSGNDGHIDLIIESDETNGQRLVVSFDYEPKGIGFSQSHSTQITPETVRKTIVYSLKNSWNPKLKGKIHRINLSGRKEVIENVS